MDAAAASLGPRASPFQRAWILWHRAEELAALGEPTAASRDLDEGLRLVASAARPGDGLFASISANSFAGYRGCCAVSLENWAEAIPVLDEAAANGLPLPWQGSAVRIDLAVAHAHRSQIDHACALLTEALLTASQFRLRGIVRRIRSVHLHELASHSREPAVVQLDEQLRLVELRS
jgi:hypothetical protein